MRGIRASVQVHLDKETEVRHMAFISGGEAIAVLKIGLGYEATFFFEDIGTIDRTIHEMVDLRSTFVDKMKEVPHVEVVPSTE